MDFAPEPRADYDSPWKELLEGHFRSFLEFFFPTAAADIDWTRGYTFLDKELAQVVRDAELGRRYVDKLVRVWRSGGVETWVLVHVEIQGQAETGFAKRMYVYNYRLFDRYDRPVASLAVLADNVPEWRPEGFHYDLWGSRAGLSFPVVKLLEYAARLEELEQERNPFAWAVAAHLRTLATRGDPEGRLGWKLRLTKMLYERGYNRQDILYLYAFIDWLMALPSELETRFHEEFTRFEAEKKMRYVTSAERIGMEKGIRQGMQQGMQQGMCQGLLEGLELGLELRFGAQGLRYLAEIRKIEDPDVLRAIHEGLKTVETVEELRSIYGQ